MNRRDFARRSLAVVPLAALVGVTHTGDANASEPLPPRNVGLEKSDAGVPPTLDVRDNPDICFVPIHVFFNGEQQRHVIAYDLHAQSMTRYRLTPSGHIFGTADMPAAVETVHGEVVVRWSENA